MGREPVRDAGRNNGSFAQETSRGGPSYNNGPRDTVMGGPSGTGMREHVRDQGLFYNLGGAAYNGRRYSQSSDNIGFIPFFTNLPDPGEHHARRKGRVFTGWDGGSGPLRVSLIASLAISLFGLANRSAPYVIMGGIIAAGAILAAAILAEDD